MSQVRRDEIVPSLFLARFRIQFIRITTPKLFGVHNFALAAKLHSCNKLKYLLILNNNQNESNNNRKNSNYLFCL